LEIDHIFIMCAVDGPEAVALSRLGLQEGSANTHPGQGTACRRFFFRDFYIELLWVHDPREAQTELVQPTGLWERWSMRRAGACSFGVVLRPGPDDEAMQLPFPTWGYAPQYLPDGLVISVARETPLTEPAIFYLGFQREPAQPGPEVEVHSLHATGLTRATIGMPAGVPTSSAARVLEASGLLSFERSDEYVLRLTLDRAIRGQTADLRALLPIVLEW
jgi:hypothetical protein